MMDNSLASGMLSKDLAERSASVLADKYGQALHNGSGNPLLQLSCPFFSAAVETARDLVGSSVRRRNLRGDMAKSGVEVPLSSVRPGAILLVGLAVVLEHSGVYLGEGKIAELHGSGEVSEVGFEQFRVGRDSDKMKIRFGDRIYVACSLSESGKFEPLCDVEAAEVARKYVSNNVSYNLLVNNCHLFSACCVNHSQSFLPSQEITTVEVLENAIANAHDIQSYNVVWLPVNIPSRDERFAEKIQGVSLNI